MELELFNNTPLLNSQSSTQGLRNTQEQSSQFESVDQTVWGRLLSLRQGVDIYNLTSQSHSFGRGSVDHRLTDNNFDADILPVISKIHFIISRCDEEDIVIIEDRSQNGTFVNESKIGKNNKVILKNNCTISLAHPSKKVFVFYDCLKNDAAEYPPELNKKYTMTRKIGEGTFGEVRLAYLHGKPTIERAAVKIVKKKILSKNGTSIKLNNIEAIENEVKLLKSVDHPCIVQLRDIIESPLKIFIVMELADGGELFERVLSGRLKEPIAKFYFYQLAHAVAYLHEKKITHRDIKPENILLATDDEFTRIKLTDFGLSKLTTEASMMSTLCGTQTYMAPELIFTNISNIRCMAYTRKVDIWSLGVVLYVCLSSQLPFCAKNDMEKLYKIKNGVYNYEHSVWNDVSQEAKDMISKLMVVDPDQRYDAEELFSNPWLKNDEDMKVKVKNILEANFESLYPRKRQLSGKENLEAKTPKFSNQLDFEVDQEVPF